MQTARLLKLGGGNYVIGMGVAPTGDQRRSAYPSGSEAGSAGQVRPVAGTRRRILRVHGNSGPEVEAKVHNVGT